MRKDKIGPNVSEVTLQKILRRNGYVYQKVESVYHIMERNHIRQWRARFIQKLNQNASLDVPKPVIYLDESWIDCNSTIKKGWAPKFKKSTRDRLQHSLKSKVGKGPRLIILHAGNQRILCLLCS